MQTITLCGPCQDAYYFLQGVVLLRAELGNELDSALLLKWPIESALHVQLVQRFKLRTVAIRTATHTIAFGGSGAAGVLPVVRVSASGIGITICSAYLILPLGSMWFL